MYNIKQIVYTYSTYYNRVCPNNYKFYTFYTKFLQ